jgi:hypothetical protein
MNLWEAMACGACDEQDGRVYMRVVGEEEDDDEDVDLYMRNLVLLDPCCADATPASMEVEHGGINAMAYQTRMLRLEEEAPSNPSPGFQETPEKEAAAQSVGTPSPRRITKEDRVLIS